MEGCTEHPWVALIVEKRAAVWELEGGAVLLFRILDPKIATEGENAEFVRTARAEVIRQAAQLGRKVKAWPRYAMAGDRFANLPASSVRPYRANRKAVRA